MLKPTRLTAFKSTLGKRSAINDVASRRVLASSFPATGALFLFLTGSAFAADAAPVDSRPSVVQRSTSESAQTPSERRLASPVQSSQELASELAQLEFRFQEAQKIGSERLDELTPELADLLDAACRLATQTPSDARLAERAHALVSQLVEFQRFIILSTDFFNRLAQLDAASLDEKATRSFFTSILSQRDSVVSATPYYTEVSSSSDASKTALAEYRSELRCAAATFDALQTLERWNAFVESRGSALERFYVAPSDAENALAFILQTVNQQGLPKEFQVLERRAAEWRFTSLNRVAIQRKILLALEAELAVKYWTFAAAPNKIYYLQQPPRPGRNTCFANAKGALASVEIPANAPEIATSEPMQRLFLQSLIDEARLIPETLRVDDAARWYAAWSAFLSRLQTTDSLDPLVQFRLLHNIANVLSTGDFYFAQRLAPTLRMLNVPRLVQADAFDVFQAENVATQELRTLARSRVAFLPTDRLTVDKTTAELDAQMERFSFAYRRVGWLDRDFSGAWRCRRPENAPLPVGDLYVLLLDTNDATNEKTITSVSSIESSPTQPRFRWLKIGSSDGRQTTLKFAAANVCRGSIVLCRSRVGLTKPVAERGELERLIRR